MQPRVTDNDKDEITVTLGGKELRGWSYKDDDERRRKMLQAREYVEGWCDGREAASSLPSSFLEFSDFLNEPPQYENLRMVRDYRHEAYQKWQAVMKDVEHSAAVTTAERAPQQSKER